MSRAFRPTLSAIRSRRLAGAVLVAAAATLLALTGCRPRGPANVLLVTLDTTRADHLGCYGMALARTPRLDAMAKEGVRCTDAVAAAPITLPSHSSILTGLYPPAHGVRDNGTFALGPDAVTLAERLHAAGYRTQAFVSALVLNRRYGLDQGFDGYDDDLWQEAEPKLFMIRSRPGPRTAARTADWLARWGAEPAAKRRPFFVWMHLFDAHQPYRVSPAERALSPSPYDAEIAVLDRSVGRVLDQLARLGVLDDTLVVVTADHGESLGEHGEKTHGVFVYESTVHVPLLLRLPGRLPAGRTYDGPVRAVDLVPTILSLLGLRGGESTQGTNLVAALRGETAAPALPQYSESLLSEVGFGMAPLFALRDGGLTWIRAPKPEVYDRRRDPQERRNLSPAAARTGARLDRALQQVLDDSARRRLEPQKSPMDRETIESLQALGYLAPRTSRESMTGIDPKDGMVLYAKLEDARHFAQAKRWAESEELLSEILVETPNNVSAVNILALVKMRRGDLAGARDLYLRSLGLDPTQARVHAMLGTLALLEGDDAAAERSYRQAIAISPDFVEAIANLGLLEALRGDTAAAEARYREAIASDPAFPRVWRRLADLEYERGDFVRARASYERVLAADPKDFVAAVQAGNAARHAGDPQAAAAHFAAAAKARPESWIPVYDDACLRAATGDARGALARLRELGGRRFPRPELLDSDPDLAPVRSLPGFAALRDELVREHEETRARLGAAAESEDWD